MDKQKRLGQYFSGHRVSKLLSALAQHDEARTIIDPMCGIGDMLFACDPMQNLHKEFIGVEFDKEVFDICVEKVANIPNIKLINSNVFSLESLEAITGSPYDLVITNPPYVRYQSVSNNKELFENYLDIKRIKMNLLAAVETAAHLSPDEKELFKEIVKGFSGLADMAVPSWILCSLLTKVGGRMAMVVPHTWLNRKYAYIVQYLLLRIFEIEYIVEDGNSTWFHPAQVKTILIVAKRIKQNASIFNWKDRTFKYCTLFGKDTNELSLVGEIVGNAGKPEMEFVKNLRENKLGATIDLVEVPIESFVMQLGQSAESLKWYLNLEKQNILEKSFKGYSLAHPLEQWLGETGIDFYPLEYYGVNVGQGLRTGANQFFYLKLVDRGENQSLLRPSNIFECGQLEVDNNLLKPVARKQSELDEEFSLHNFEPNDVLLYLSNLVLQEDNDYVESLNDSFKNVYKVIPANLSEYIRRVASTNIGEGSVCKFIPELSAVKSNKRKWDKKKPNEIPKFWYQLPPLTKRHTPDLFIPRINNEYPKTRLNPQAKFIIDANFSSIWISSGTDIFNNYSLLATLNSSWCIVCMEKYGTVMGGGALKLEAAQLRKIPVPVMSADTLRELSLLGRKLEQNPNMQVEITRRIDDVFLRHFGFDRNLERKLTELSLIKRDLLIRRSNMQTV